MKLLLVEDDAPLITAVTRGLRGAGYAVDTAGSAEEGVGLLRLNAYDIVVLDLGLPDVGGLPLLRRLRDPQIAPPALLLTARGELTDRVAGWDAGADDYLQKPFAFPELLARLRALLRRGVPVVSTILRVSDLELDPARFEVHRRGTALSLTAKEFAILE